MDANPPTSAAPPLPRWVFLFVMLAATLIRGGAMYALRDRMDNDIDAYRGFAETLLQDGVYGVEDRFFGTPAVRPSAYRAPLFPLVLSKIGDGHGIPFARIQVLQLFLGVATVAIAWLLCCRWGYARMAPVAALLVACDPLLVYWSAHLMSETLATFLAVTALWTLSRYSERPDWWSAGLSGGILALAILCRPVFLVWFALAAPIVLFLAPSWKTRITNSLALIITAAVILAPWSIRNYAVFGHPIITTTHGGYTLLLGNNAEYYAYLRGEEFRLPSLEYSEQMPLEERLRWRVFISLINARPAVNADPAQIEVVMDAGAQRMAIDFIRDDPGGFGLACLYRLSRLWGVTPNVATSTATEGGYRQVVDERPSWLARGAALFFVTQFALAFVGLIALRKQLLRAPWLWGVLLCASITFVHTFYWTDMRMRAPMIPVLCLAAAVGVDWLWRWWRTRKNRGGA